LAQALVGLDDLLDEKLGPVPLDAYQGKEEP
jgi:hypothetical protein